MIISKISFLFHKIHKKIFLNDGFAYASYLKKTNTFYSQGNNCYICKDIIISEPYLTRLGSNVWITRGCVLLGHDASVIMLNEAKLANTNTRGILDKVGPIIIGDNCFIGINSIILPDIKIGNNTIIGTGSVVTKDIPDNCVYAGNPAQFICSIDDYLKKINLLNEQYSWKELLEERREIPPAMYDKLDCELESRLKKERINYFFKNK